MAVKGISLNKVYTFLYKILKACVFRVFLMVNKAFILKSKFFNEKC